MMAIIVISRAGRRLGVASAPVAVLGVFAASQIVVSLLGEGVRDLGKHLAAGQYALDLAIAMLATLAIVHGTAALRMRPAAT